MKYLLPLLLVFTFAAADPGDPVSPLDCQDLTGNAKAVCCWLACDEEVNCMVNCLNSLREEPKPMLFSEVPIDECIQVDAIIVEDSISVQELTCCP